MKFIVFCLFASLLTNCNFFRQKEILEVRDFKFCANHTNNSDALNQAKLKAQTQIHSMAVAQSIYQGRMVLQKQINVRQKPEDVSLEYKVLKPNKDTQCVKINERATINFYKQAIASKKNSLFKILENAQSLDLISKHQAYINAKSITEELLLMSNIINALNNQNTDGELYNLYKKIDIQTKSNLSNVKIKVESQDSEIERIFQRFIMSQNFQLRKDFNVLIKISTKRSIEIEGEEYTCNYTGAINIVNAYNNTITHSKMINFSGTAKTVDRSCRNAINEYQRSLSETSFNELLN